MKCLKKFPPFFLFIVMISVYCYGSDTIERVKKLNREIVLLNLINGLYLEKGQMKTIIKKIEEAEIARQEFISEFEQNKEFEDLLVELKGILLRGEDIPANLKRRVHQNKQVQYELEDRLGERLLSIESEVISILTPNQLKLIEEYKPCTIPPAIGRIGQSVEGAAEGLVRMFSRIRNMPEERYQNAETFIADLVFDRSVRHMWFKNSQEEEEYRSRIVSTFRTVREMSDKEFLLKKSELAERLLPEEKNVERIRKNRLGKVGRFLLDPALIPILKQRLR